jgi:hypothetical protein
MSKDNLKEEWTQCLTCGKKFPVSEARNHKCGNETYELHSTSSLDKEELKWCKKHRLWYRESSGCRKCWADDIGKKLLGK